MITFLSHKLRSLMIVLLAIVGISFIFFGNWTPSGAHNDVVGKINGQTITNPAFAAALTATGLIYTLQTGRVAEQSDALVRQAWSRLLILDAANRAGIDVSEEQAVKYIRSLPLFQNKEGKYDPAVYDLFDRNFLSPRAISVARLIEIVRDQLRFEAMVEAVSQTAFVQPSQVSKVLEQLYGPAEVSVIRFDLAQFQSQIKPTAEQLQDYYEKNKSSFQTPEKRQVQYLAFKLTPRQQKLTGKERSDAMQELGQKAFTFAQSLNPDTATQPPSFEEGAEAANQTVSTSPYVAAEEILLGDASLTLAAFNLTRTSPVSDVLEVQDGYYVFKLSGIQPAQPIPFAQVQAKVSQDFIKATAFQQISDKAVKARETLAAKLAAGADWPAALQAAGVAATDLPAFVPAEGSPAKVTNADIVGSSARKLMPGQLSELRPTNDGVLLVYLKKRGPVDEAKRAKIEPLILAQLEEQSRYQVVGDWVLSLSHNPGTQNPRELTPQADPASGS